MMPDDVGRDFRKAWADLFDELIDGGPWRWLFRRVGWERGQWPSQATP